MTGNDLPCRKLISNSSTKTENKMKGGFFLNVVITQSSSIFKLLTSKNQTLLIRRNTLFVLDLSLYIINGIRRFHIQGDGLSSQGFDKNLHSSTKTKHQVKS